MRFISTKFHGVLDYLSGVLFIASPWLFHFNEIEPASWVMIIIGLMIILLSALTNYEGGLIRKVAMTTHLTMDLIAGLFLAASPWLLGFADQVYLPHLILGIFEMGAGLFTSRHAFEHDTNKLGSPLDH